eukprot:COSAG01_NODE_216_length_21695_cov_83.368772_20_plen_450_part_00
MQIKVPNLGDGVSEAQVLSVMIAEGDTVSKDQTLLEVETDKAVAPVPATQAGVVKSLLIKEGVSVKMGDVICELDSGDSQADAPVVEKTVAVPVQVAQPTQVAQPVQVQAVVPVIKKVGQLHALNHSGLPVPTSPAIRRAATLLGIDLSLVPGTGSGGRILANDVAVYIQSLHQQAQQPVQQAETLVSQAPVQAYSSAAPVSDLPDFSKFGPVETSALSSLRKKIGAKMSESWQAVPHVTQFADADITNLMKLREKYKGLYKEKGAKLSVMVMLFPVFVEALKAFPNFNSSYDAVNQNLILKKYYNLGVAVDTEAGLIVPVLKDVDQKSLFEISQDVVNLAEKARERSLAVDALQGGSFTISNLGSFGVGPFTPIVNVPEVAIMGLGRSDIKVVPDGKRLASKTVLPLSLSYDHRVIDGADAARFVAYIMDKLANYDEALLEESLNGTN